MFGRVLSQQLQKDHNSIMPRIGGSEERTSTIWKSEAANKRDFVRGEDKSSSQDRHSSLTTRRRGAPAMRRETRDPAQQRDC